MAKGVKTGGRKKGTPNKVSARTQENIEKVFIAIGGITGMAVWAKQNKGQFYSIYARLARSGPGVIQINEQHS